MSAVNLGHNIDNFIDILYLTTFSFKTILLQINVNRRLSECHSCKILKRFEILHGFDNTFKIYIPLFTFIIF